ncbi:CU044_5270 family protein [Plantactinospora sp. B6F1]|uniref:CU044_5270 family protein n=1 Tax=Plantactinospora sp. B6F1 TaxID=3158971 RepID=UPI0032D920AF
MSRSTDVMNVLAKARPARLNAPGNRGELAGIVANAVAAEGPATLNQVADAAAAEGPATLGQVRRPGPRRMALVGAVGAIAAAAVVVAVAGPNGAPDSAPEAASGVASSALDAPMDYKRLLLVAAERSDKAPRASGRYLTVQTERGYAQPVETAEGTYVMFERYGDQYWLARSSADSSWAISQELGAKPATPTDEARWRRNGSPAVMRVTKPKPSELKIAQGEVERWKVDPDKQFALGDLNVSQAELDALPTDPAALRSVLLSRFTGENVDMPRDLDQWLFTVASAVVFGLPVSNQVRAAGYRLLATVPGVRGLGVVHDVRGRRGQAIAYDRGQVTPGKGLEVRLIFDPETGRPLAEETRVVEPQGEFSWMAPGSLSSYSLVLAAGATNDSPPVDDARD